MESPIQQLKVIARKLQRAPLFTLVTVLTLAVGIGANTAIFSVVHGVLIEPLPYPDSDRLATVSHRAPGLGVGTVPNSEASYLLYRDHSNSFASFGIFDGRGYSLTRVEEPAMLEGAQVTHQILPMLAARPEIGRLFTAEDGQAGAGATVILTHGLWEDRFGADPSVLGRSLTLNGTPHEVIGVLEPGVDFMIDADLFSAWILDEAAPETGSFSQTGVGRLAAGVTLEEANAEIAQLTHRLPEEYPGFITARMLEQAQWSAAVTPLKDEVVGDVGNTLWILLGTVGLVLLVACANVANLFLVRAEGRQREIAVRSALGAGRKALTGFFLLESAVLAVLGGVAGVFLAAGGLRGLLSLQPGSIPRIDEIGLSPEVLVFTAVIALLAALLFGIFPVLRYARPEMVSALKEGGRGGMSGRSGNRARHGLVVAQMAMALVLLVGSGLLLRSYQNLRNVDPGFDDPESVLTVNVTLPLDEYGGTDADALRAMAAHFRIMERLRAVPGVEQVGVSNSLPMSGRNNESGLWFEDLPVGPDELPPVIRTKMVSPSYFETLGIETLAGQLFTDAQLRDQQPVLVVNRALAERYFGSVTDILGRRARGGAPDAPDPWHEIVAVVDDVRDDGPAEEARPIVYFPFAGPEAGNAEATAAGRNGVRVTRSTSYVIRVDGEAGIVTAPARAAIWDIEPNAPLANMQPLAEIVDDASARTSFTALLIAIAALIGLFLGAVGIYGVLSYVVSQRVREIGVRLALGARPREVSGMVLKQAGMLTFAGIGLGLAAALALGRVVSSLLFGVSAFDPLTFGAVTVSLSVVALFASWLPARRASRVEPVEALRAEQ